MISRSAIKKNAKAQLGGLFQNQWMMLLVACVLKDILTAITAYISIFVAGPLAVGLVAVMMPVVRGEGTAKPENMFKNGFADNLGRNILLGFMTGLFTFLWALLFIIPGIVKSYSYSMAPYLASLHPEWDWKQCIDESKRLTKGYKGDLFILDLSFIGWIIVCVFTFGLGFLWLAPYVETTKINYYEAILAADNPQYQTEIAE